MKIRKFLDRREEAKGRENSKQIAKARAKWINLLAIEKLKSWLD